MAYEGGRLVGVAISGGGVRAALFSLGACLYLDHAGIRRDIRLVTSVSGGSITNAVLAATGDFATTDRATLERTASRFARALVKEGSFFFPGWRRFLLASVALFIYPTVMPRVGGGPYWPAFWFYTKTYVVLMMLLFLAKIVLLRRRTQAEVFARVLARATGDRVAFRDRWKLQVELRLRDLPKSSVTHVLCATELHSGRPMYLARGWVFSPAYGWGEPDVRVRDAIYASAAFPAAFPPLRVRTSTLALAGGDIASDRPRTLLLADGGVFNNLGTDFFKDVATAARSPFGRDGRFAIPPPVDLQVVVNASSPPRVALLPLWWPRRNLVAFLRIITILYENTVRPRIDRLAETSGDGSTFLVDIASSPLAAARAIAETTTDRAVARRARALERALRETHGRYWDEFVALTSTTKTQLSRVGEATAIRLLRHGYLNALVTCHTQLDTPGLEVLPDETWFAGLVREPARRAAAEQDRHLHDVEGVDQAGGEELADDGRPAADAHVEVAGRGPGEPQRLLRGGVDEVEHRPALHLDRRARVVREDEDRRVERRVRSPPAAPLVVGADVGPGPGLRAELAPAHDLGADAAAVPLGERVVDARGAAALADHRAPEPRREHPLVQAFAGVPERRVERDAVTRAEPVQRDREVVDPDL